MNYQFLQDIDAEMEVPTDGTLSRTIRNDDDVKVVLFGFATGQELSEHTAAMPAILHVVRGELDLTLGDAKHAAAPGAWIFMEPNLPHSLHAKSESVVVLVLLKKGKLTS